MSHAIVIGRGLHFSNSFEFALKLMETNYVVAAAFSAANFAHGADRYGWRRDSPSLCSRRPGQRPSRQANSSRDSLPTVSIPSVSGPAGVLADLPCAHRIELHGPTPLAPGYPADVLTPICSIVPAQLFAAHLAAVKGLDPDHPRMLSKVTHTM